jgi:TetR/AcrR family transcriptional repressor of nem operon
MHHIKEARKAMRYDAGYKQRTRERILDEAAGAIRRDGPDRIAVAGIMAKAGLTHGGFYAHFKSKDDLVAAAMDRMFDEADARLDGFVAGHSAREGLAGYIRFYLSRAHRDARASGCPMPTLTGDLPRLPAPARQQFSARVARLKAALDELLTRLGRPQPEAEASSLMSELIGALALARAEPDPVRSDAILARSKQALKQRFELEDCL